MASRFSVYWLKSSSSMNTNSSPSRYENVDCRRTRSASRTMSSPLSVNSWRSPPGMASSLKRNSVPPPRAVGVERERSRTAQTRPSCSITNPRLISLARGIVVGPLSKPASLPAFRGNEAVARTDQSVNCRLSPQHSLPDLLRRPRDDQVVNNPDRSFRTPVRMPGHVLVCALRPMERFPDASQAFIIQNTADQPAVIYRPLARRMVRRPNVSRRQPDAAGRHATSARPFTTGGHPDRRARHSAHLCRNRRGRVARLGWLHAGERLFQMELLRAVARG